MKKALILLWSSCLGTASFGCLSSTDLEFGLWEETNKFEYSIDSSFVDDRVGKPTSKPTFESSDFVGFKLKKTHQNNGTSSFLYFSAGKDRSGKGVFTDIISTLNYKLGALASIEYKTNNSKLSLEIKQGVSKNYPGQYAIFRYKAGKGKTKVEDNKSYHHSIHLNYAWRI